MRKLAIVDDCELVRQAGTEFLTPFGWDVVAFDAQPGIVARLEEEAPEVVLIDCDMPYMSGEGLVRLLRSPLGIKNAVLILHSSCSLQDLREISSRCGADGALQKSGSWTTINNKIRRVVASAAVSSRLSSSFSLR